MGARTTEETDGIRNVQHEDGEKPREHIVLLRPGLDATRRTLKDLEPRD